MTPRYLDVFAQAARIWRAERPVLAAVAGIFFFLPQLALLLFLPVPDTSGLAKEASDAIVSAWIVASLPWLAGLLLAQGYGTALILTLVLDPARPTLGEAMAKALRSFPKLVLAQAIMFGAIGLVLLVLLVLAQVIMIGGTWLLALVLVPGFYLVGRLLLTAPTVIAEPELGAVKAVTAAFDRARGRGWWLLMPAMLTIFASLFLAGSPHQLAAAVAPIGPLASFPLELLSAVLASGCSVALVLIQAVLYRALGSATQGPRQGM